MTFKRVTSPGAGDASHFGGTDVNKFSDIFGGTDISGSETLDINTATKFRSGKLRQRNPANTFEYTLTPAAIIADRTLNLPLLTATDTLVGEAFTQSLTNKTIDVLSNTMKDAPAPDWIIWFDTGSSQYKALKTKTGAVTSNASECGALFNSAIDDLSPGASYAGPGGWIHFVGKDLNVTTTIILKTGITISGAGKFNSSLKLGASQNKDVLQSQNFLTLTGTNLTGGTNSGPYAITLRDFSVDGNEANQSVGATSYGLRKYGWHWLLFNVSFHSFRQDGIWSEWGVSPQAPFVYLSTEDNWFQVECMNNWGRGCTFRGPHDTVITHSKFWINGLEGFYTEVTATYSGQCYLNSVHTYTNGQVTATVAGLRVSGAGNRCVCTDLTCESESDGTLGSFGVLVENLGEFECAMLTLYSNDIGLKTQTNGRVSISNLDCSSGLSTGLDINSNENQISNGRIWYQTGNAGGTGYGIKNNGELNQYTGLDFYGCKTASILWTSGNRCFISATQYQDATYPTVISGSPSFDNNTFAVKAFGDGVTEFKLDNSGTATIASGTTSIVVAHGISTTPATGSIRVVPTNNPTTDPGHIWLSSIGATNFTINCRTNPGTGGATFAWSIRATRG